MTNKVNIKSLFLVDVLNDIKKRNVFSEDLDFFIKNIWHAVRTMFESDVFVEDHTTDDVISFASFVLDLYDFIQHIEQNNSKTLIADYKYSFKLSDRNSIFLQDYSLVVTLNKDNPFLVDSISNYLKKNNNTIYHRANIVFKTERDQNNVLKKLHKCDCNGESCESLIFFITKKIHNDVNNEIKNTINNITSDIKIIVNSWKEMLSCIDNIISLASSNAEHNNKIDNNEFVEFCKWLKKDSFIFFGIMKYHKNDFDKPILKLGIAQHQDISVDCKRLKKIDDAIHISRSTVTNIIHRMVNLDVIRLEVSDDTTTDIYFVFGLFSRLIDFQDLFITPIVRQKVDSVIERASFVKNGHTTKSIVDILRSMPRTELLTTTKEELYSVATGLLFASTSLHFKMFIFDTGAGKYLRVLIYISNKYFTKIMLDKVQKEIEKLFKCTIKEKDILFKDDNFIRMKIGVEVDNLPSEEDKKQLEYILRSVTEDWEECLYQKILCKFGIEEGESLYANFQSVFPITYQKTFDVDSAIYDIQSIQNILKSDKICSADLYDVGCTDYHIKIYSKKERLSLSYLVPVIENMGFKVMDNHSFKIEMENGMFVWIQHFLIELEDISTVRISHVREQTEEIIRKVLNCEIENDYYNSLTVVAGLNWRDIMLIRSIGSYLKQIKFPYSDEYIQKSLARNANAVKALIEIFNIRFSPLVQDTKGDFNDRKKKVDFLIDKFCKIIDSISNVIDDKIVRGFLEIIKSILRTNFFLNKEYISFKINSQDVSLIPIPKPFVEVYVYSTEFEGIHLRGGMVARGGLRWSDRTEDFRTEVMGLWKAQMPKNVTIVPVGSKGGFIVKNVDSSSADFFEAGVLSYKKFLSGILDITDNIVDDNVVKPNKVVCYDGDDTYLVVAADKGTATFSNYANEVSNLYNFWLGDAFASGGSSGYDHKKMGITTKGAWSSVVFHFWFMNRNISKETFTVVGIGDMAGDVFGNAMIISDKIKLLAAFNHNHIFIDPNPDIQTSFIERKRMFDLPKSQWTDYNIKYISKGGGIFSRFDKSITLTTEIKEVFDIKEGVVTPSLLIRYILKSRVDLIWNGGIGTFVKSSSEVNEVIGDKNNDAVRVNGEELRAKIVGEGGNLGFTQLGRIEYAHNGGLINTDFIDNTCGVCCSDYEVNIKIAFSSLLLNNEISLEERDNIFASMEDEVAHKILSRIAKPQALILIRERLNKGSLEQYQSLIKKLETISTFNRQAEYLPDNKEINRMIVEKRHFTVPRLSVIMAYTKMYLYEKLLNSPLMNNEYLNRYLFSYFPLRMRSEFPDQISNHPLKKEIVVTFLVNFIVNRAGITFVNNMVDSYGVSEDIICSILIAISELYGITGVWIKKIEPLVGTISIDIYYEIEKSMMRFANNTVSWFLNNYGQSFDIQSFVEDYRDSINEFKNNFKSALDPLSLKNYQLMYDNFINAGLSEEVSNIMTGFKFMDSALPIIQITRKYNKETTKIKDMSMLFISKIYYYVGYVLKLNNLRRTLSDDSAMDYWSRVASKSLKYDIYEIQKNITLDIVKNTTSVDQDISFYITEWKSRHSLLFEDYDDFVNKITLEKFSIDKLLVLIKRLEYILKK